MGLEEAIGKIQTLEDFIAKLRKLLLTLLSLVAILSGAARYYWGQYNTEHMVSEQKTAGVIEYAQLWETCRGNK